MPKDSHIRNEEHMDNCWVNWKPFDDCWPRGITVSDGDGLVEMNGYMLQMEKKNVGELVSKGQGIMFENMARSKNHAVVIIWCRVEDHKITYVSQFWFMKNGRLYRYDNLGNKGYDQLKKLFKDWAKWADEQPFGGDYPGKYGELPWRD